MSQKWQERGNSVRSENVAVNYWVAVFPGLFEMLLSSSFRLSLKVIDIT